MLTRDLFAGRGFEQARTLAESVREGAHADRLGVFAGAVDGRACDSHAEFWGTVVYYVRQCGLAVSGVTTVREARPELAAIAERIIAGAAD